MSSRYGMMLSSDAASSSVYSGADNREPFYYQSKIAVPAQGNQAAILQFLVRRGANGWIQRLGIDYIGAGFTEGSGSILFTIYRDAALTKAIKGFANLTASIGAVNNPLEIPPIPIYEAEVISIVGKNVSLVGAGNSFVACAVGWFYPKPYGARKQWPR